MITIQSKFKSFSHQIWTNGSPCLTSIRVIYRIYEINVIYEIYEIFKIYEISMRSMWYHEIYEIYMIYEI